MSNMQRKMGTFALTMTGIGSIIGSGMAVWSMESSSNCGTRGYFFMGYWNGGYFDHCPIIC